MRNTILLLAGVLLTGCATEQPAVQTVIIPPVQGRACAALVFDAPITFGAPPVEISRDDRGPAAFIGYEEATTSYYSISNDNRQSNDYSDGFVRETVTAQTGAVHR